MPTPFLPALTLLLALPGAADAPRTKGNGESRGTVLAQLSVRQRIIIRMPRPPVNRAPDFPRRIDPERMAEKKGPKCVPVDKLAGSAVGRKDSVDLLLSDGTQIRARLDDDCPALDFYAGFYLRPTADRMLCADRDVIRARSGRACPIANFKRLVPKR